LPETPPIGHWLIVTGKIRSSLPFLFKTNQTKLNPSDPTIPKAQWVTKDKVADLLTHQKDKKFFLRIINQI